MNVSELANISDMFVLLIVISFLLLQIEVFLQIISVLDREENWVPKWWGLVQTHLVALAEFTDLKYLKNIQKNTL